MKDFRVAGHRGVREGAPENTMKAFAMAVAAGVDMIETDIRQSKDGRLMLMHDEALDRTTNGHGNLRDYTYAELRALDAGEGEKIPELEELFEYVARMPGMELNLELKDYPHVEGEERSYETARKAIALAQRYGIEERCLLNSFSGQLLNHIDVAWGHEWRLHGFYPYSHLGENIGEPDKYLYCACLVGKSDGGIYPKEYYDALSARGIQTWLSPAVRSREALAAALDCGGRLVTSDNPSETFAILREINK